MSARPAGRMSPCTRTDARARLRKAESFLAGAELLPEFAEDTGMDLPGVAAALAVLAGIAAGDAACCAALGQMARGQDHKQAVRLLATVRPHGEQLAKDLSRLLDKKDSAHYGVIATSASEAATMTGWARGMIASARDVVVG